VPYATKLTNIGTKVVSKRNVKSVTVGSNLYAQMCSARLLNDISGIKHFNKMSIVDKILFSYKATSDRHSLFLLYKRKGGRRTSSLYTNSSVFYWPGASDKPLAISSIFY